jgi:hypothetical protein
VGDSGARGSDTIIVSFAGSIGVFLTGDGERFDKTSIGSRDGTVLVFGSG